MFFEPRQISTAVKSSPSWESNCRASDLSQAQPDIRKSRGWQEIAWDYLKSGLEIKITVTQCANPFHARSELPD
jgi:hypothetical protein